MRDFALERRGEWICIRYWHLNCSSKPKPIHGLCRAKLRSTLTGLEIMSQSVVSLQAVFAALQGHTYLCEKLVRVQCKCNTLVISQRNDTWDGSILVWICSVIHDTRLNLQSGVRGAAVNNTQTQWQCSQSTKHCLAPWELFVVVDCSGMCSPTTKMLMLFLSQTKPKLLKVLLLRHCLMMKLKFKNQLSYSTQLNLKNSIPGPVV